MQERKAEADRLQMVRTMQDNQERLAARRLALEREKLESDRYAAIKSTFMTQPCPGLTLIPCYSLQPCHAHAASLFLPVTLAASDDDMHHMHQCLLAQAARMPGQVDSRLCRPPSASNCITLIPVNYTWETKSSQMQSFGQVSWKGKKNSCLQPKTMSDQKSQIHNSHQMLHPWARCAEHFACCQFGHAWHDMFAPHFQSVDLQLPGLSQQAVLGRRLNVEAQRRADAAERRKEEEQQEREAKRMQAFRAAGGEALTKSLAEQAR